MTVVQIHIVNMLQMEFITINCFWAFAFCICQICAAFSSKILNHTQIEPLDSIPTKSLCKCTLDFISIFSKINPKMEFNAFLCKIDYEIYYFFFRFTNNLVKQINPLHLCSCTNKEEPFMVERKHSRRD